MRRCRIWRSSPQQAWLVAAVLCGLLLSGCGSGSADREVRIDLGTDVQVTDVDGDGRADVLSLTHQFGDQPKRGLLTVRRQTATGAFAAPESYVVGCYPWSMTHADIDGDRRPDLVVLDVGYANCDDPTAGHTLLLLRQDATRPGRFLAAEKLASDVRGYHAAVADLNGDGRLDMAFYRWVAGSERLAVLYQDPRQAGRFEPVVETAAPGGLSSIVAGDIDGDGRADLFFVAYGQPSGYVPNNWLGYVMQRADGTLAPAVLLSAQTGVNVQRLEVLDLDGDGHADLLAHFTPFSTDYAPFLRALRHGPAALTWSSPIDSGLGGILGVDGTAFGDIDQDGHPDVVLAGSWPESAGPLVAPNIRSRVNLLFGQGDGRYAYGGGIDVAPQPGAVAIGDLDGDGRNDLVLHDGSTVWWMRQSPRAPASFGAPQPLP